MHDVVLVEQARAFDAAATAELSTI